MVTRMLVTAALWVRIQSRHLSKKQYISKGVANTLLPAKNIQKNEQHQQKTALFLIDGRRQLGDGEDRV
jgi:hypothetical protein